MFLKLLTVVIASMCVFNVGASNVSFHNDKSNDVSFEKKISYNLADIASDNSLDGDKINQSNPSVSVTLEYSESFSCSHKFEKYDEVLEHRKELKEYYTSYNEDIIDSINLRDYESVTFSKYGPFIEFTYSSTNDFMKNDYNILKSYDSSSLENIFIEEKQEEDQATRNSDSYKVLYDFSQALTDVGIPVNKTFTGKNIKIGCIENGIPKYYNNLINVNYEVLGNYLTDHAFMTSSVFGGNSGIANDASIYFAALDTYSFAECTNWLIEKGVNIINRSNGGANGIYDSDSALADYLVKETKLTFVNSAGNDGDTNTIAYPSTGINVLSVASNDSNLAISSFSSAGLDSSCTKSLVKPTLTAPGGRLKGIANVSGAISGTSFSAPIVTGIVAMLMEEFPNLKSHPEEVMSLLTATCTKANGQKDVFDRDAGFGIVNYELARQNYANNHRYTNRSNRYGTEIGGFYVHLGFDETLKATACLLYNADGSTTNMNDIDYSGIAFEISDNRNKNYIYGGELSNFAFIEFTNTTYLNNMGTDSFKVSIYLSKPRNLTVDEYCSVSYLIEKTDINHNYLDYLRIENNVITGFLEPTNFDGHLVIPDYITGIGKSAFAACESLISVSFGENSKLKKIEGGAFTSCYNLKSFTIPKTVTKIDFQPFLFSENVVFYTELTECPSGWYYTWNVVKVDYAAMDRDIKNNIRRPSSDYWTYAPVNWGYTG